MHVPLGAEVGFFLAEDRRAGGDHLLVVGEGLPAARGWEEVAGRLANGLGLARHAEQIKVRLVVEEVVRGRVLDEDAGGEVVVEGGEDSQRLPCRWKSRPVTENTMFSSSLRMPMQHRTTY